MSEVWLLSEAQMRRIELFFPLSHGVPRVDDRRVISGIIFVLKKGLRWRDAPPAYGPHKTIYNRFIRGSRLGVFNRIFAELAAKGGRSPTIAATGIASHRPSVRRAEAKAPRRHQLKQGRTSRSPTSSTSSPPGYGLSLL